MFRVWDFERRKRDETYPKFILENFLIKNYNYTFTE